MTFQVAANGQSVQTATGPQQLLNDQQPLTKLDTTRIESFQTISILFNHEPPQADPGTGVSDTLLYSFKHPYDYIPAIWMEWQNHAPAYPGTPPVGGSATTFFDFGDDTAAANIVGFSNTTVLAIYARANYNAEPTYGFGSAVAFIYAKATKTDIEIHMIKNGFPVSGAMPPIFVIGTTVDIRLYVFTEPAITSTY